MSGTVANNLERSSGTIGAAGSGIIVDSGDPAIDSNPAGGLGTVWSNSTSGETYVCTDATPGTNVWTNVGDGTGDIEPWLFGGTSYGFVCGNHPGTNAVDRWSFASGTQNGEDWGDTVGTTRYSKGGNSDKDNGYSYNCGGYNPPINEIIRFSMTSSSTSNDVGDMTQTGNNYVCMSNATHGWAAGSGAGDNTRVEKMAFASSGNASDWSDLVTGGYDGGGATNTTGTYGYFMGGWQGSTGVDTIQKINLTSQATSTSVSTLHTGRQGMAGNSSSTHGYCTRGSGGDVIDKFNMSTDADATFVGDAVLSVGSCAGSSSTTYGYAVAGSGSINVIEKVPFASDTNATDVGDLTKGAGSGPGGNEGWIDGSGSQI